RIEGDGGVEIRHCAVEIGLRVAHIAAYAVVGSIAGVEADRGIAIGRRASRLTLTLPDGGALCVDLRLPGVDLKGMCKSHEGIVVVDFRRLWGLTKRKCPRVVFSGCHAISLSCRPGPRIAQESPLQPTFQCGGTVISNLAPTPRGP